MAAYIWLRLSTGNASVTRVIACILLWRCRQCRGTRCMVIGMPPFSALVPFFFPHPDYSPSIPLKHHFIKQTFSPKRPQMSSPATVWGRWNIATLLLLQPYEVPRKHNLKIFHKLTVSKSILSHNLSALSAREKHTHDIPWYLINSFN